jgi:hypothetical protein
LPVAVFDPHAFVAHARVIVGRLDAVAPAHPDLAASERSSRPS